MSSDNSWNPRNIMKLVSDETRGHKRIPTAGYQLQGRTPVVDQSQILVAGYTEEPSTLTDPPYIVFGDHTREIKYLDQPFLPGAQGVRILKATQEADPKFLYHYLAFNKVQNLGYSRHFKLFKQIEIHLPPLAEQQHIAEILDVTQRQFDLLKAKKTHLASLRTELVDQILEADDRETVLLKEIAEIQSGITKGRKARKGEILTETAYMAVSNVKDGHLDLETVKTIPATEAEITRSRLKTGDVLLTEGGDPDKLGRGTVWRDEIEPCLHQNHIFRVRLPEDSRFTPEVLMAVLSTKQARAYFFRSAKQTTGIASINKTQLSAVPVPILTDSEIAKLSEALTQIDILSSYIEKRRIATERLHRALSTRAFAGQL